MSKIENLYVYVLLGKRLLIYSDLIMDLDEKGLNTLPIPIKDIITEYMLDKEHTTYILRSGNLQSVHWWFRFKKIEREEGIFYFDILIYLFRHEANVDYIEWIQSTFNITWDEISYSIPFKYICSKGYLDIIKWIDYKYCILRSPCIEESCFAFKDSCGFGHLKTAKWLFDRFKLTTKEPASNNYEAFRRACKGGYLDVVKWLDEISRIPKNILLICIRKSTTPNSIKDWIREKINC
jgi:hypothetical protein